MWQKLNLKSHVSFFSRSLKEGSLYNFNTLISVDLPSLNEFLFSDNKNIEMLRWEMLLWSLSLNKITLADIDSIPKTHIMVILALIFMVQVTYYLSKIAMECHKL